MNINSILKSAKIFVIDHGPEILTAAGTVGLIVSGIMAVSETPKALDILEAHSEEKFEECGLTTLTKKEIVADCWKIYLPSILMAAASVTSIIFARRIDSARAAAWAAAYRMSEEALLRIEESTKEELGQKKFDRIEDRAEIKEMAEHPVDDICITGNGDELFFDCYSARYFRSNVNSIDKAINLYTKDILDEDYCSINDWESRLGLTPMDDDIGEQLGINSSMMSSDMLDKEITYGPGPNDEPCGYLKLSIKPIPHYWNPHG